VKPGQIESFTYRTGVSSQEALIFVPERYSPLYKYGILFLFDGLDYLRQGMLSRAIEEEFGPRLPFLIALLPVAQERRTDTYDPAGDAHADLLHTVAGPLLRALEARFALMPLARARAIGGASLGAAMALSTIARYPRRFGHLYAQSPAYSQTLAAHLEKLKPRDLVSLDAHLSVGEDEDGRDGNRNFVTQAKACEQALLRAGAAVTLQMRSGAHGWQAWQKDVPILLHLFADGLSLREDRT